MHEGDDIVVWLIGGRDVVGILRKQGRETVHVECIGEHTTTTWVIQRSQIAAMGRTAPNGS